MFSAHRAQPNEAPQGFEISDLERTVENRTWVKSHNFTCKFCSGAVTPALGERIAWHFRHKNTDPCRYREARGGRETRQHLALKKAVYTWLKTTYPDGTLETDVDLEPINKRIPDVVLTYMGAKLAFECQYSPLPLEELKARTLDLQAAGLEVTWIFSHHRWSDFAQHIAWLDTVGSEVMNAHIEEVVSVVHEQIV